MKKKIQKPDGTVEEVEGTAEELAEYERRLRGKKVSEQPTPKNPGLLTDELTRSLTPIRTWKTYREHKDHCLLVIAQSGWWSVVPPTCTCGVFGDWNTITTTSANEI